MCISTHTSITYGIWEKFSRDGALVFGRHEAIFCSRVNEAQFENKSSFFRAKYDILEAIRMEGPSIVQID